MKKIYYFLLLCFVSTFLFTPVQKEATLYAAQNSIKPLISQKQAIEITIAADLETLAPETTIQLQIDSKYPITEVRYIANRVTNISDFYNTSKSTEITATKENLYSLTVTKNGLYSFYAKDSKGNETYISKSVLCIDSTAPQITISAKQQQGSVSYEVSLRATDKSKIVSFAYLEGAYGKTEDSEWAKATEIESTKILLNPGKYTFRAKDIAGNTTIEIQYIGSTIAETEELKAVWISYLEFSNAPYTEASWKKQIDTMFDQVVANGMNAVIVHVRPFSDAFYPSAYYPWSTYVSGKQGKDPGFDPLAYMVTAAKERDLQIHAWLNPYRVTSNTTDVTTLSKNHPARKWLTDAKTSNDRNVLSYGGKLYYNPASNEVQNLIINGVKELVTNYDLDGIHFDDYFYPTLGKNYKTNFDAKEYNTYCILQKRLGKTPLSIADWRRENVNTLVRGVYAAVKKIDENVQFGISPGGFIDYLTMDDRYYVDYETWLSYDGYIDYLCPQLYWTNSHSIYPFNETLLRFIEARTNPDVKLYVGIASYKAGLKTEEAEWYTNKNVLKNMISFSRQTNEVDGFMFFRYDYFISKKNNSALKNMLTELKKSN